MDGAGAEIEVCAEELEELDAVGEGSFLLV